MRSLTIGLAIFSASGFLFAACGNDPGSTTASATSSTSGTGGAPSCEGVYIIYGDKDGSEPCDICLHDYCCAELSECRDQGCIDCVNLLLPSCGPKPRAVTDCLYKECQPICSPGWAPTSTTTGG
jgi:hypothetical protein